MPIVTISRDSYCPAKEVAEKAADKLGFECISGDVLAEASQEFDVSEVELLQALRDAPSFLDRLGVAKETYVAYIQVALLAHFQKDNVVYHGLAGHHFAKGIAHVLKVRIIAEQEERVRILMERQEVFKQASLAVAGMSLPGVSYPRKQRSLTREEALRVLEQSDKARRKWSMHMYGIDTHDPNCYDLMLHVKKLTVDDAAEMIAHTARLDRFQATPESQQAVDDLLLAARVKTRIIRSYPRVEVHANRGIVSVCVEGVRPSDEQVIRDAVEQVPGLKQLEFRG